MAAYEKALQELYQAPLPQFLAERKRLSSELRAGKEMTAASEIGKRRRPTASVWAVNQLYWHARQAFDEMLGAAKRLRDRELRATKEYHEAIAELRKRAANVLEEAGLGTSDATLRRVASTLSAIAAAGGFDPDPPGALSVDRDPPGFEAAGIPSAGNELESDSGHERKRPDGVGRGRDEARDTEAVADRSAVESERRGAAAAERRAERQSERERRQRERADRKARQEEEKRRAAEAARRKAERKRVETKLRAAAKELKDRERKRSALEAHLRKTEEAVGAARKTVEDLERALRELAADEGQ